TRFLIPVPFSTMLSTRRNSSLAGIFCFFIFFAAISSPHRHNLPTVTARQRSNVPVLPVATQYHVSTIPRVEIYGRKGELVGTVKGADPAQVRQYVAQAKSAARQKHSGAGPRKPDNG